MNISKLLSSIAALGALAFIAVAADSPAPAPATYTVTLTDVHVCCGSCVKGVTAALADMKTVTGTAEQAKSDIIIVAPDKATAQQAVDKLTNAGFFGKSSDTAIKVSADTGAKPGKVSSLEVSNLHLCCGKCVTAVNGILKNVNGVTANTAATGAKTFIITGDFSPTEVFAAFQKAGLTGKAGATIPEVAPAATTKS